MRATILPAAMKVPLPRLLRLCSFGELQLEDWRIPKADCFSAVLSLDRGSLCFLEASLSNFLGATAGGRGQGSPETSVGPEVPYGPRTVHAVDAQARPRAALDRWQFRADCVGDVSHLEAGL